MPYALLLGLVLGEKIMTENLCKHGCCLHPASVAASVEISQDISDMTSSKQACELTCENMVYPAARSAL
jgi:hypothetical protein